MDKRSIRGFVMPVAAIALTSMGGTVTAEKPVLHTVATAHLDTQWNWTVKDTIEKHIPDTLRKNMAYFDKYPEYVFNFEGAFRYRLAKEYYPDLYERLKGYVKAGRWKVAGSTWDAMDPNVPSPESVFRNILYGNGFFDKEFGMRSRDIFLPDSFGFGYALPSIAAASGLLGFSTQKLTWGSAFGVPFDLGKWTGPDGSSIVAALNAGDYTGSLKGDLSNDGGWVERINRTLYASGVPAGYLYHGVGDIGGAPKPESMSSLAKSIKGKGPIKVVSSASDQLFRELNPKRMADLEEFRGELLMTKHGTGSYTSRTVSKRWNRQNEVLGDAAERANAVAEWMGIAKYPMEALTEAWKRFLWHQFHDDITGTSIPEAYQYSWNDYILSLNAFSAETESAVASVSKALDTRAQGVPVVVYNPLSHDRTDIARAVVDLPAKGSLRVYGPDGREVPSQVEPAGNGKGAVTFVADVPSVGFAVFDVRQAQAPCAMDTGVRASESGLENGRYRVDIDTNGDVSGIYDKVAKRRLLSAPMRWEMLNDRSDEWPAWEILYGAVTAKPREYVAGSAEVRVVQSGPARVAVEITRNVGPSSFVQVVSLASGKAGDRVDVSCRVQWNHANTLLKASFPLGISNREATYNLGLGTIRRGNNTEALYEVPAQQWADLTDASGKYGVTIMSDCKYGWDKPSENRLRLTLIHTPTGNFNQQGVQDFGENRFSYAVYGHEGDWSKSDAGRHAEELGLGLMAFIAKPHAGTLGRTYSFVSVGSPQVGVMALKKAEEGDEVVIRLQESTGKAVKDVAVRLGAGIASAREINAQEEPLGPARVKDGLLMADFGPYRNRTFAVRPKPGRPLAERVAMKPIGLPYDTDIMTFDGNRKDGGIPGKGLSIPGELVPDSILSGGVTYRMGPTADGKPNAVSCKGQVIPLPKGTRRLYVMAASAKGDTDATFGFGGSGSSGGSWAVARMQDMFGNVGQWDNHALRVFGLIKRDPVAFVATHLHSTKGNITYEYAYGFAYPLDVPEGAESVRLPDSPSILILAMTAADGAVGAVTASPMYDVRDAGGYTEVRIDGGAGSGRYPEGARVPVSAEVPPGYAFVRWEGPVAGDAASPNATVIVGREPVDVKAVFRSLGTNVALGKKAKANQNVTGETPEKALDGSADPFGKGNSKWCSTEGSPKWLMVDLGKEYAISRWAVRHAGSGGEDRGWNTRDFELQVSPDGRTWGTVDRVVGNTDDVTLRDIARVTTRYVRLYITNTGSDKAARIYEFEVYTDES